MNRFLLNYNRRPRTPIIISELWLGSTIAAELIYTSSVHVLFWLVAVMAVFGATLYFFSETRGGANAVVTIAKIVIYTAIALAAIPVIFWFLFNVVK